MFQFPAFALPALYIQAGVTGGHPAGFPHSEIYGSTPVCRLPVAYRRLPRPSSPLDAKTSTVHPSSLDHVYRSPSHRAGTPARTARPRGLPHATRTARDPYRGLTEKVLDSLHPGSHSRPHDASLHRTNARVTRVVNLQHTKKP
jgi:hypothetical protein